MNLEQNNLYSRYNTDDVFNRCVISGLLNLLNHRMSYDQIWQDNVVENVYVPFMCDFGSSDERFAQDNYTFFGESCFNDKKITGKFDMLPRGAVKYTGSNIDASNITNRFVKGFYLKNENGKLTSYSSFLYSIPITFNFDVELRIDNIITAFKIEQAIRETFYKNKTFYVLFRGMKINCTAGFPETVSTEKTTEYSFDSERNIKMSFSLAVEAYQPVFDHAYDVEASKRIEHVGFDVELMNKDMHKSARRIEFKNINNSIVYPAGSNMLIEWNTKSEISDMCTVTLTYFDEDGTRHKIDDCDYNHYSHMWHIPDEITDSNPPIVVFNDQENVIDEPIIKVIPKEDGTIDESSFMFLSLGRFSINNGTLGATVEYTDKNGDIQMSDAYSFNVVDNIINSVEPVSIEGSPLRYKGKVKYKRISLEISYDLDPSISDRIDNILIY